MKTPTTITQNSLTFEQFNKDLTDFYKYLKSNNSYSDEEIRKILAPVRPSFTAFKTGVTIFAIMSLGLFLYFATYIETISWHFSAIGRIILIKLLPYWDWTLLKNEKCLLFKPSATFVQEEILFNCDLCENLQQIDFYSEISEDFLKNRYLDVDLPVIIQMKFPQSINFIGDLLKNDVLAQSKPCSLSTNVQNSLSNINDLIHKTDFFESFFIHFQNCDFNAMKQFRGFTGRPSFLPRDLSPVQYNWLLWSRDYNISQFKRIPLVEKYTVIEQMQGANFFQLSPRKNCEGECPVVEVKLQENEVLVLTSLWDLEYKPEVIGENLAVILEMH